MLNNLKCCRIKKLKEFINKFIYDKKAAIII